jgi:hypothetical protein
MRLKARKIVKKIDFTGGSCLEKVRWGGGGSQ